MATPTATAGSSIDLDRAYALVPGIRVVPRRAGEVQIGTEPPRCVVLHHAPENAPRILRGLAGGVIAGELVHRYGGDPRIWTSLLRDLVQAGLLTPAIPPTPLSPSLQPERACLVHRHGPATADRLMRARQDSLVVVRGAGRLAGSIAALLAASGVGQVHQRPDGRPTTAGQPAAPGPGAVTGPAWHAPPTVWLHEPPPQLRPELVVLAGQRPPDPAVAAQMVSDRVPHLAVQVGLSKAVIGPLVLPGRSSCLGCADRTRADADPGWPRVAAALQAEAVVPPSLLAEAAAGLAVEQALDHLDGVRQPETVNGTLDRLVYGASVRRRSWTPHRDCGCRLIAADDAPAAGRRDRPLER